MPEQPITKSTQHVCAESRTCQCYLAADAPNEDCPVHGFGVWPPKCVTCGRFLRWPVLEVRRTAPEAGTGEQ